MRTQLHSEILATDWGREADRILRSCVHCGFCTATCPTYRLLGDELDGPRGRIYLIKEMLELETAGTLTQRHLDRCLTCRACESTCPSGVEYGRLLEIGREYLELNVPRGPRARLLRWLIRRLVPHPRRFGPLLRLGQLLRPLLPRSLREMVPRRERRLPPLQPSAATTPRRKVVLLEGCVQRVARASTNAAARTLLQKLGVEVVTLAAERCCGAIPLHLGHGAEAEAFVAHNAELLDRALDDGAEAIVSSASGCGATFKDYHRLLRGAAGGPERGRRVSDHVRDLSEYVLALDPELPRIGQGRRVAFQTPCSLQHGQRLVGAPEALLERAGYALVPVPDAHLCCGSAGAFSLLETRIAGELGARKLRALQTHSPDLIATANIGCQLHLEGGADVPVRHWVELLSEGDF